jgi:hypothetical protein
MRDWRTEQCKQGIADEFVNEATELLHCFGKLLEQLILQGLHEFRVDFLG